MKALLVNASPRKGWNTAKMLEAAKAGAEEAGAESELVNPYDFPFAECRSCFACKLENAKTNGVCAIRDELRPVLERARQADVLVLGSPIYFSYPTGVYRAFLERAEKSRKTMAGTEYIPAGRALHAGSPPDIGGRAVPVD